jgi:ADP-heptose:LPS heptosyltransferase
MADKYIVFHIDGGAGKSVMATALCPSFKQAYPEHKLIVVTAWPEVFLHNPNVYRVYKTGNFAYFYDDYIRNKETIVFRIDPYHSNDFIHQSHHLIKIWCDLYNIPVTLNKPQLFLTQRELIAAAKALNKQGEILIINSSGGADGQENDYSWARDIPPSFAQQLVNEIHSSKKYEKILHIRRANQIALENTIQLTDSLRNLFCFIVLADKLILIDSLAQHVAAAFNKQSAVAWIGNNPNVFGYESHINITPSQNKSFRHSIDSYLEDNDWIGRRYYECPFDDIHNILNPQPFLNYALSERELFTEMPKPL